MLFGFLSKSGGFSLSGQTIDHFIPQGTSFIVVERGFDNLKNC